MKRVLIILFVLIVLAFSGLRIYGAYQTEKQDALRRAEQAQKTSKAEQAEADNGEAEINCSLAWGNYHLAEQKAELARMTGGDSAYYREQLRALALKPFCDYDLSHSAFDALLVRNLGHSGNAIHLKMYAEAEGKYAASRKLQSKHLLRKTWAFLTGTSESTEDWMRFLTEQGCFPK
jgi:hypothetical protein